MWPRHDGTEEVRERPRGASLPARSGGARFANTIGEQTLQHRHRERQYTSDQEEKAFRRGLSEKQYGLEERKFGNTQEQQQRQFQQHELDQAQRAADAAESRRIQQQTPEER